MTSLLAQTPSRSARSTGGGAGAPLWQHGDDRRNQGRGHHGM